MDEYRTDRSSEESSPINRRQDIDLHQNSGAGEAEKELASKACNKCHVVKPLTEFYKRDLPSYPDGHIGSCKVCERAISVRYNKTRTEAQREDGRKSCRTYHRRNRDRRITEMAEWRRLNPDSVKDTNMMYKKSHREEINARLNARYATDPVFKSGVLHRVRLRAVLKRYRTDKSESSVDLLGCSVAELTSHIESLWVEGMSWHNHGRGNGTWQIDHILPCCSFDLTDPEHQRKCFHYTNLRPLWHAEHSRKSKADTAHCRGQSTVRTSLIP